MDLHDTGRGLDTDRFDIATSHAGMTLGRYPVDVTSPDSPRHASRNDAPRPPSQIYEQLARGFIARYGERQTADRGKNTAGTIGRQGVLATQRQERGGHPKERGPVTGR
jgi:hypothetical protein